MTKTPYAEQLEAALAEATLAEATLAKATVFVTPVGNRHERKAAEDLRTRMREFIDRHSRKTP